MKRQALLWSVLVCATTAHPQAGSLDLSFNPSDLGHGFGDGPSDAPFDVVLQPDGKAVIVGAFETVHGATHHGISRLNTDGTVDPAFDPGDGLGQMFTSLKCVRLRPDGRILIAGQFTQFDGAPVGNITQLNSNGSVDASFVSGGGFSSSIEDIVIQPDGRALVLGSLSAYGGTPVENLVRLLPDGSLDPTFTVTEGPANGWSLALQADGKILVAGIFTSVNGVPRNGLARLNDDGSLDMGFDPVNSLTGQIADVIVQPDGKLILTGNMTVFNGVAVGRIVRLESDGSMDVSFNTGSGFDGVVAPGVMDVALQPDGRMLVSGRFLTADGVDRSAIARLNTDGSLDPSFDPGSGCLGYIHKLALQNDGAIIAVGLFDQADQRPRKTLVRFDTNGTVDPAYAQGTGMNGTVHAIAVLPDGAILAGGDFTGTHNTLQRSLVKLQIDGSLDAMFDIGAGFHSQTTEPATVNAVLPLSDGGILVGGDFHSIDSVVRPALCKLNPDGSLDPSFNAGLNTGSRVHTIIQQPDGKFLIGGKTSNGRVARLHVDGTLDSTFAPVGLNAIWDNLAALALQPDGRVIMAGKFPLVLGSPRINIARLNTDGSLDPSFDAGNLLQLSYGVSALALQPDGKVLVAEEYGNVLRLEADGSVDATFIDSPGLYSSTTMPGVQDLLLLPDGKIIAAGWFEAWNGTPSNGIVRMNTDGSPDPTFDPGTGFTHYAVYPSYYQVHAMALQPDGQLLAGGSFTSFDGIGRNRIARLNMDFSTAVPHAETAALLTYPNPSSGIFNLTTCSACVLDITITDITGRVVMSERSASSSSQRTIDLSGRPPGLYTLYMSDGAMLRTANLMLTE
ncbi:MAG: T9SS type A sorting domain-containing protein [Flavobacteriales bacterium]|nr:T9SS type A sorting domain-containing protein [Flavobacteriales bacterium]MBP6697125.1 T9SS type A sorting domain-containing protein [Flavobacteriales bacterium]